MIDFLREAKDLFPYTQSLRRDFRFGVLRVAGGSVMLFLDRLFSAVVGQARNRERYPLGYYFIAR